MQNITNYIKESRNQEVDNAINKIIEDLESEGYSVEFGKIGERTTYALLYTEGHESEIVGYTFIRNVKYYKENIGKLRALEQAIVRKEMKKD